MEIPKGRIQTKIKCLGPTCDKYLCTNCQCLWHDGITCNEYQMKRNRNDSAFERLKIKNNWSACPKCGFAIEKTEGCNHMTHQGCPKSDNNEKRTDFCYCCKKLLIHKQDGSGWKYDIDGNLHFDNGYFQPCVNANINNNKN